jgi:isopenicillin N synthase-like dioxygenase
MGPSVYPSSISDPLAFREVTTQYHRAMTALACDLLKVIALGLGLEEDWFADFAKEPIATLRLLRYPPQEPDADEFARGIDAHTDFGAITLLLQDSPGGLQVFDKPTSAWIDVVPTPGALVVNLGNQLEGKN